MKVYDRSAFHFQDPFLYKDKGHSLQHQISDAPLEPSISLDLLPPHFAILPNRQITLIPKLLPLLHPLNILHHFLTNLLIPPLPSSYILRNLTLLPLPHFFFLCLIHRSPHFDLLLLPLTQLLQLRSQLSRINFLRFRFPTVKFD